MKNAMTILAALALCSGCALFHQAVPTTEISGTIAGQQFSLSNPKDTSISNLVVEVGSNGVARLSIGSLTSVNNSNVIGAAYSGQASVVAETGTAVINAVNAGAALAGKAAAASAK